MPSRSATTPAPTSSSPPTGAAITAISTGEGHTCAVTSAGGVRCWGNNSSGQLGNGSTTNSSVPVDIAGLATGVRAISAGFAHTCALTTGGGVKCWGSNIGGELGNGSTTDSSVPVDVAGLATGVSAISAGFAHTCALTTGGGVRCWGNSSQGELGNGSTTDSSVPVDVAGLASGITAVAAGEYHTCALTSGGEVRCWGSNSGGALGNGTMTTGEHSGGTNANSSVPVDVVGLGGQVSAIAAGGFYTCALMNGGGVMCWGSNSHGELGDQASYGNQSLVPVDVAGLGSGISAIAAGVRHACALTRRGAVKCWGSNDFGELGNVSAPYSSLPVDVAGLASGISAIAAGEWYTCALTGGGVKCWGWNLHGQLGDGSTNNSRVPVEVVFAAQ